MAISRKPKTSPDARPTVNVDELIAKGGSVAAAQDRPPQGVEEGKSVTSFTLRVPNEILETLDEHRKNQVYKVPRQQWIVEAIMQRLEREMLPYAPKG